MALQLYNVHLVNGDVLQVGEDYDLRGPQTIVNRFYKAGDNDILEFRTPFTCTFPARISCSSQQQMCWIKEGRNGSKNQ